jgi:hypothetical protein
MHEPELSETEGAFWYTEASLRLPGRVLCAGTLAQCVRRWRRLSDFEKQEAELRFTYPSGQCGILMCADIAPLAATPALRMI